MDYRRHTPYTDPGPYGPLLDALPTSVLELSAVVRNVLLHYRGSGVELAEDRMQEINNRWVERILATDQSRHPVPLAVERDLPERVAGCCRDYTLLSVAALRQHGIPARSRVGFANYIMGDFRCDHVVLEYFDGSQWRFADNQFGPGDLPLNPAELPRLVGTAPAGEPYLQTAAQVWTGYRRDEIDPQRYGVAPDVPVGGAWFIRDYVILELAHRYGDELLLWDDWGAMGGPGSEQQDVELIDEVARLLLAADDGDEAAERDLHRRYVNDPRLHPGEEINTTMPTTGARSRCNLATRPAVAG